MEIFLRATVMFAFLFLLTRGLRRRALSELAPFEMILLVTLGDVIQQGITQEDFSLTGAIVASGTFGFWIMVLTWATWRFDRVQRVVDGVPIVLVQDGEVIDAAMRLEQMPVAELFEAARQQGIEDLRQIRLAVLEPSGKISIIQTSG
jgi:uncharacterized membrane protein YcaP (DUF421 family)